MKRAAVGLGLIAFLMILAGGSLSAQVGERPRDTDYTEDAEDALDDAEDSDDEAERQAYYATALTAAEAEIAENPNNPLGHRLAALASLGLHEYAQAGAHFDHAKDLYPLFEFEDEPLREQTWMDLYQQASPLVSSGDYEEATEIFEDAHAIYQSRPEVMITLAQLHATLGNYDRALELMDGISAFMAGAAETEDEETMAGWQEQADVLPVLRAQTLAASGRAAEAADAYRALSAADPDNGEYVRNLAAVLMDSGDEAGALAVYEQMLTQPGLSGQDLYAIGIGFYQASDYMNAAQAFKSAAEQNPKDRDSLEMWARSLLLEEVHADIPPVAEQWVALDPYSQTGYLIWAQAANLTGDTEMTQQAMGTAQELEVAVDQLQLQRFGGGGGQVSGSIVNKTLAPGTSVTLDLTFYGNGGSPIGTVTSSVTVGEAEMAEIFSAQFDSAEPVGGYSYELSIG